MSGGRIPRAFIDDLLVRVDIVDLIDAHVPLKKTGTNFVARCPFHTEKTPSFSVNRNKQFYYCFGCGASGNAISFLMDFNHLDFVEAIEDLANFAGVDVPREALEHPGGQKKNNLAGLYLVMEQVAVYYMEQLRGHADGKKAAEYLKARGITGEVAKDYLLGYAPNTWRSLSERFDTDMLHECGLLGRNDSGEVYGRFRSRIMFPIRDKRGRVIGFGGRVLDDTLPKYLNSPETPLFHKGKEVYGLYELLQKNAKPQRILIVEGYMDVIALAQFGIYYAVATLGTTASQAHLELLFRFSSELVFCFDGDKAGRDAAWRAMEPAFPCLRDGRQIRIVLLPSNDDPDSLVRKEGVAGFSERLEAAETLSDYFFGQLALELNLTKMEGRAQLINKARPYLEKLPECVFREMMFARLKELSGYGALEESGSEARLSLKQKGRNINMDKGRISSARAAIALLVQNPGLVELIEQKEIDWANLDFHGADLFKKIMQAISNGKPANTGALLEIFRGSAEEKPVKALAFLPLEAVDNIKEEFCDAVDRLLAQSRAIALERLLAKEKSEGLSQQEKETLRKWLLHK